MPFLKSKYFIITLILQIAGPLLTDFGTWANIIQYVSAFGIAYALWDYHRNHKQEISELKELVLDLHIKHDRSHKKGDE